MSKRKLALKTLAEMECVLAKAAQRIRDNARWLLEEPDDPEALHQYRISLRVARSLLKFVRPYCNDKRLGKMAAELKVLQAPTSRIRELDMLVGALDAGTREMFACREARASERAAFMENMRRKGTRKLVKHVTRELEGMPWRGQVRKRGISREALAKRVGKMSAKCAREMDGVAFEDHESVHDVRKHVKALRYITREFAICLPEDAGKRSAEAKAIQDQLGDLCDCRNDARIVAELCGAQAEGTLLNFAKREKAIVAALNAQR